MRWATSTPRLARVLSLSFVGLAAWACAAGAEPSGEPLDAIEAVDGRPDVADDGLPPPLDSPVDLVPWARLAASGLHAPAGVPWPREARDAVATVRDGHDDTGWWVPQGQPSWLELDLQVAFGAALALDALTVRLQGEPPTDGEVDLLAACGAEVLATRAWPDPTVPLDLGGASAGCLRLRWTAPGDLRVVEASLTSRDGRVALPPRGVGSLAQPGTSFANHGVVEGFYGVPWSWRERRHLLVALARWGLTSYVYAPKNDPLHRDQWRTPYPAEALAGFADLAALASELGLSFLFGVSPLIDFDFSSEADYQALLTKLASLQDAGAIGACLLADDIELEAAVDVGADLGAAHAALANRLLADLRARRADARLWFVPTAYSDARRDGWEGGPAYLEALRALHADVPVLWTGTDTFSPELAAADLAAVHAALGREPLIWDNFWANDGGDGFFGRLLLGPLGGRAPDLPNAIAGLVQNPSIQGASTRLALGTYAAWLADPAGYDPVAARRAAVEDEQAFAFGAGRSAAVDREILSRLLAVFDASTLDTPRYAALAEAVSALHGALAADGLPTAEARALLTLLAGLVALGSDLHHSGLDADLVDDVAVPVEKARSEGELGLAAMALLGERLAGRDGADALALAKEAAFASKTNRFQQEPRLEEALLKPVGAVPAVDRGFAAPGLGDAPPACRAGASLAWRPFEAGAELAIAGLPGATLADGTIRWRPPHAGAFRAVVVGATALGWASRTDVVVCR
jgi:hypothetical protein